MVVYLLLFLIRSVVVIIRSIIHRKMHVRNAMVLLIKMELYVVEQINIFHTRFLVFRAVWTYVVIRKCTRLIIVVIQLGIRNVRCKDLCLLYVVYHILLMVHVKLVLLSVHYREVQLNLAQPPVQNRPARKYAH